MKSKTIKLFAVAALTSTFSFISHSSFAAQPAGQNAAPFGLEIGVATCDAARARIGALTETKIGDDQLLAPKKPSTLYEGATSATVRCSGNKVIAVQFQASKGGMSSEASREVYAGLSKKYKVVAGGPMPSLGNGYARFASGNSIIEEDSPHLSFEFTVTYFEKGFYDSIVASNKEEAKKSKDGKQSSL